ncbi:MAG TPA: hypothetical protein VHA09_02360 [Nitrososphaera sp.]|nr:hypothetical protein [Nitrososphaera sp.]
MPLPSTTSPLEIKRRLEQNWIQFLSANSARLSMDTLDGSSPPSVFVGRYGYPKVRVGPMIPPVHGDTTVYDRTEMWVGKTLEEIANLRLSLVRGVMNVNVGATSGRYIENLQELAMSERPAESEATFEKKPLSDAELGQELRLNTEAAPFGPAAPIKTFRMSSVSADQKIESAFYDGDMRAKDAVVELYERGIETSRIHRVLSVGMLGLKKGRKLVPTRWSITATDDIISASIIRKNEANESIDLFEVRQYSHIGNFYSVILIPDSIWSFEMIESWYAGDGRMATGADYEDARGLDHYPTIAGAYFAARLAVAEHLSKRRRKGAALVLREIHPEYVMPVGVWQIREGVREALKKPAKTFEGLDGALSFACSTMSQSRAEILGHSQLYRNFRSQTRITDFS